MSAYAAHLFCDFGRMAVLGGGAVWMRHYTGSRLQRRTAISIVVDRLNQPMRGQQLSKLPGCSPARLSDLEAPSGWCTRGRSTQIDGSACDVSDGRPYRTRAP